MAPRSIRRYLCTSRAAAILDYNSLEGIRVCADRLGVSITTIGKLRRGSAVGVCAVKRLLKRLPKGALADYFIALPTTSPQ